MPSFAPEARRSGREEPIYGPLGSFVCEPTPFPCLNSPDSQVSFPPLMIRKATASVLLLLLGLYLPASSMTMCVCLNPAALDEKAGCCQTSLDCGEDADPCWGESDCCIVIPGLPDGMEPQLIQTPNPVSLPVPLILADEFVVRPVHEISRATLSNRAPPPLRGAPVRIAFGVWRL